MGKTKAAKPTEHIDEDSLHERASTYKRTKTIAEKFSSSSSDSDDSVEKKSEKPSKYNVPLIQPSVNKNPGGVSELLLQSAGKTSRSDILQKMFMQSDSVVADISIKQFASLNQQEVKKSVVSSPKRKTAVPDKDFNSNSDPDSHNLHSTEVIFSPIASSTQIVNSFTSKTSKKKEKAKSKKFISDSDSSVSNYTRHEVSKNVLNQSRKKREDNCNVSSDSDMQERLPKNRKKYENSDNKEKRKTNLKEDTRNIQDKNRKHISLSKSNLSKKQKGSGRDDASCSFDESDRSESLLKLKTTKSSKIKRRASRLSDANSSAQLDSEHDGDDSSGSFAKSEAETKFHKQNRSDKESDRSKSSRKSKTTKSSKIKHRASSLSDASSSAQLDSEHDGDDSSGSFDKSEAETKFHKQNRSDKESDRSKSSRKSKTTKSSKIKHRASSLSDASSSAQSDSEHEKNNSVSIVNSAAAKLLNQFENDNGDRKQIDTDSILSLDSLTSHDELFLLYFPKTLPLKALCDLKLSLTGKSQLVLQETKYTCTTEYDKQPSLTLLATKKKKLHAKVFNPKAKIRIQRHLENVLPDWSHLNEETVEFPQSLKTRHPLFGLDYPDKINLEESVTRKLGEAVASCQKQHKRKKRKRVAHQEDYDQKEEIFTFLNRDEFKTIKSPSKLSSKERQSKKSDIIQDLLNEVSSFGNSTKNKGQKDEELDNNYKQQDVSAINTRYIKEEYETRTMKKEIIQELRKEVEADNSEKTKIYKKKDKIIDISVNKCKKENHDDQVSKSDLIQNLLQEELLTKPRKIKKERGDDHLLKSNIMQNLLNEISLDKPKKTRKHEEEEAVGKPTSKQNKSKLRLVQDDSRNEKIQTKVKVELVEAKEKEHVEFPDTQSLITGILAAQCQQMSSPASSKRKKKKRARSDSEDNVSYQIGLEEVRSKIKKEKE